MKYEKKRTLYLKVRVSPEEMTAIKTNMNDGTSNTSTTDVEIDHSYISSTMINQVNTLGEKAQRSNVKMLFSYLESADFDKITDVESFPPLDKAFSEKRKLKNIFSFLQ